MAVGGDVRGRFVAVGVTADPRAALVSAIEAHYRDHWEPPTVRELQAAVGWKSPSTVHKWLKALAREGRIEIGERRRMVRLP